MYVKFEQENQALYEEMNSMAEEVRWEHTAFDICVFYGNFLILFWYKIMLWTVFCKDKWGDEKHMYKLYLSARKDFFLTFLWRTSAFFRQIEGKVVEIAKLQEIFTEKVLEQVSA